MTSDKLQVQYLLLFGEIVFHDKAKYFAFLTLDVNYIYFIVQCRCERYFLIY